MDHPGQPRRRTLRLPHYNYSQPGAYFVTICSYKKRCIFGEIIDRKMMLNRYGEIVETAWSSISDHFPTVITDQHIVMPNHLHGILIFQGVSLGAEPKGPTLGSVVGAFKSVAARRVNKLRGLAGAPVWQRNYYEHIVRNEQSLDEIRQYIVYNPGNWHRDPENV